MNGFTAQIIALCLHARKFLETGSLSGNFFEQNSTSQFCRKIFFTKMEEIFTDKYVEKQIASNPDDWFRYLRSLNPKAVRINNSANYSTENARMTNAFVGGGVRWNIEVVLNDGSSEIWNSKWEIWNRNSPEKRLWEVQYHSNKMAETAKINSPTVSHAKNLLKESLEEIAHFAKNNSIENFYNLFLEALNTINSNGANLHGYHRDLYPDEFASIDTIVLLDACQRASVFGGMGSWNDIGSCGDMATYKRVSDNLYNAINLAIEAAVNN